MRRRRLQNPFAVDSGGSVGKYTSIAVGDSGYPVIAYYDSTNEVLKVTACTTAVCTGTPTITTVDSDGSVGKYTSISIGNNGNPVISYYDHTDQVLKVAACTTTDCSGTPTITTVDSDGIVGRYSSIAIGDNGYPVISYEDTSSWPGIRFEELRRAPLLIARAHLRSHRRLAFRCWSVLFDCDW